MIRTFLSGCSYKWNYYEGGFVWAQKQTHVCGISSLAAAEKSIFMRNFIYAAKLSLSLSAYEKIFECFATKTESSWDVKKGRRGNNEKVLSNSSACDENIIDNCIQGKQFVWRLKVEPLVISHVFYFAWKCRYHGDIIYSNYLMEVKFSSGPDLLPLLLKHSSLITAVRAFCLLSSFNKIRLGCEHFCGCLPSANLKFISLRNFPSSFEQKLIFYLAGQERERERAPWKRLCTLFRNSNTWKKKIRPKCCWHCDGEKDSRSVNLKNLLTCLCPSHYEK